MSRTQRILTEIFFPPLIGTIVIVISGCISGGINGLNDIISDGIIGFILGIPALLFFAYLFGILPSLLYALIMEILFSYNFHNKLSFLLTVSTSTLLGLLSGYCVFFLSQSFTQGSAPDLRKLIGVGISVGIIMGFVLACCMRRQSQNNLS